MTATITIAPHGERFKITIDEGERSHTSYRDDYHKVLIKAAAAGVSFRQRGIPFTVINEVKDRVQSAAANL